MEKLNKYCICCYQPFKEPSKFTYCYNCSKLSNNYHCIGTTKSNTQCKLKAIELNNNRCFFHKENKKSYTNLYID